jgi:hypothetical protein
MESEPTSTGFDEGSKRHSKSDQIETPEVMHEAERAQRAAVMERIYSNAVSVGETQLLTTDIPIEGALIRVSSMLFRHDAVNNQTTVLVTHPQPGELKARCEAIDDHFDEWDDDNGSSVPSYAASVFTVESLASSASALSNRGDYSAQQIATATRELVNIVSEDDLLVPLYQSAIDNPDIGPDRLQRNLRRLFKAYADNLEEEGEGRIEFLASRLVANKAQYLAKYIVEKFQPRSLEQQADRCEEHDDSSDNEDKVNTVSDHMFDDLRVFGDFLVGSAAFSTLRAQIQSFVMPKVVLSNLEVDTKTQHERKTDDQPVKVYTWESWLGDAKCMLDAVFLDPKDLLLAKRALFLVIDSLFLITDALAIDYGLLEPPLSQNATRLRWKSVSLSVFL